MDSRKRICKDLAFEIILFCAGIASISLFFQDNLLLTAILIVAWAVGIKFWHKKNDVVFFIVGAVVGPMGEVVAIYYGAWHYTNPSFIGIPIWLPFAWGLATMLTKRIADTITGIKKK